VEHSDQFPEDAAVWDVRTEEEFAAGAIPGAVNVPLDELRERLHEAPKDRQIIAYCKVGQRGYMATRILRQHELDARNLSGGYTTYQQRKLAQSIVAAPVVS
jgi:rhodanese-related sulfurtransferase